MRSLYKVGKKLLVERVNQANIGISADYIDGAVHFTRPNGDSLSISLNEAAAIAWLEGYLTAKLNRKIGFCAYEIKAGALQKYSIIQQ